MSFYLFSSANPKFDAVLKKSGCSIFVKINLGISLEQKNKETGDMKQWHFMRL